MLNFNLKPRKRLGYLAFLVLFVGLHLSFKTYATPTDFLNYQPVQFKSLYKHLGYKDEFYFNATEDEVDALTTYTEKADTYYKDINKFLRSKPPYDYEWYSISPEEALNISTKLNSLIDKMPLLPAPLILYRGLTLDYRKNRLFTEGESFSEAAFFSTSTNLNKAYFFATQYCAIDTLKKYNPALHQERQKNKSEQAILVLYMTSPQKAVLMDQGEDEVLFKTQQKLKIMKARKVNDVHFYLTQMCGQSDCAEKAPENLVQNFLKASFNVRCK